MHTQTESNIASLVRFGLLLLEGKKGTDNFAPLLMSFCFVFLLETLAFRQKNGAFTCLIFHLLFA